ncbi:3'(2'),5'-bisphosphate nucleotidase [Arboricoccus pini]|uniref:3'(2'),5'-bisphosphate nucleotidase CysQ n=1 Tax=Arboricoccus pini TaxID=1963835 RepID=A0A212QPL6_9PROT|nr:3'(2'),5'-bisphosphate nucleotidase CysQ [Arboricoccus pini]SNB61338.1 3'(2'),5'-bisphosphate nucleotidase [Arboricoccus pini]
MIAPALLMPKLVSLIDRASAIVLEIYASDFDVARKEDASPVTLADEAAEALIVKELRALTPNFAIVAEEEVSAGKIPDVGQEPFWLVDPLDGTKEFISRNGEFTVNIGLVHAGLPILGVVAAPARGIVWWGAVGQGAVRRDEQGVHVIQVRPRPDMDAVAVASRSHRDADTDAFLAEEGITKTISAGSSLKFCLVAQGEADVYPRFAPTMEWDTAAGHAVLRAAGGRVSTRAGGPLLYGKAGFRNPSFLAAGA